MRDYTGKNNPKFRHGMWGTTTYRSWRSMIDRCYNPNNKDYKNYGGRGIEVSLEWRNSFIYFFNDMGEKPISKTLDRKDNEKSYSKENCKWSTKLEQCNNRRQNTTSGHRDSGLRGVRKCGQFTWRATIKNVHIGTYMDKNGAAKAYNQAAIEWFGTKAKLNIIK